MKKTLSIVLLASVTAVLAAQDSEVGLFAAGDSIVGKTTHDKTITAKRYRTPDRIYQWHWDETAGNLLLELRRTNKKGTEFKNDGNLLMIGLDDKTVKWSHNINYKHSEIASWGTKLFLQVKDRCHALEPETGNLLWQNKTQLYFIDTALNIGVGYPAKSNSDKLSAIDLRNGATLWTSPVGRSSGWNDTYMLNDSLLLISVDGIRAFNLPTGNSWHYEADTEKKEVGKMIASNVAGIALGVLTGVYVYQSQPDQFSEMTSNMLIDKENNILIASRDRIARVAETGEIIWSTRLPVKLTSKSSIFLKDSTVYMINRGFAFRNGQFKMVGDPYFAAFSLADGSGRYLNAIAEKSEFIRNYQVINDRLYLVFQNKISVYSLEDGTLLTENSFSEKSNERLDAFATAGLYIRQDDSLFLDLTAAYPDRNFMMTEPGGLILLTDSLETLATYAPHEIFRASINAGDYLLLTNDNRTFSVCSRSGECLAQLRLPPDILLVNNRLYAFDEDSLLEVDMGQLE